VARQLSEPANELWLSPVSVWEALLLHSKQRLRWSVDPIAWVMQATTLMHEAPLAMETAIAAHQLAFEHPDPADKFLAATAGVLGLTLVTADQRLSGLGSIATLANR
jgi:PIN domain nuclease of toxin-antitoxin system